MIGVRSVDNSGVSSLPYQRSGHRPNHCLSPPRPSPMVVATMDLPRRWSSSWRNRKTAVWPPPALQGNDNDPDDDDQVSEMRNTGSLMGMESDNDDSDDDVDRDKRDGTGADGDGNNDGGDRGASAVIVAAGSHDSCTSSIQVHLGVKSMEEEGDDGGDGCSSGGDNDVAAAAGGEGEGHRNTDGIDGRVAVAVAPHPVGGRHVGSYTGSHGSSSSPGSAGAGLSRSPYVGGRRGGIGTITKIATTGAASFLTRRVKEVGDAAVCGGIKAPPPPFPTEGDSRIWYLGIIFASSFTREGRRSR